ncbi:MFS transporter [Robbsia sp. KACC 23696]|uniref:MFS transporter n=1 Tax=Robbsia sp. KACC 23696 TaxID=3149231 RepID=UPI00325AF6A2
MKIGWYSELTPIERRTYWACFGGYTLDSLDSTMYALLVPVLIAVLGLSKPQIGLLATSGLIGNAIGGWAAGIMADRIGRITVLKSTILWVAAFSLLAAATSGFHELLVVRGLQGLGYGGEAAVGGVLISEAVRPALRGRVAASVQSGFAVGYAMSTALMPIVFQFFPQTSGWRVMFVIGVVPAVLVLLIRRSVPESGLFETSTKREHAAPAALPVWRIFQSGYRRSTALGLLLATGVLGAGFGMSAWLPAYLRLELHLSAASMAGYLAAGIVGSLLGPFLSGFASDRIGRRATFIGIALCEAAVISLLLFARLDASATLLLIFLHGTLQSGFAAGLSPTFAELFETRVRANGSGFCVTGGRGIGAIFPAAVGTLSTVMPLGHAMGLTVLVAFAAAIAAALLLPERSGTALDDVHPV